MSYLLSIHVRRPLQNGICIDGGEGEPLPLGPSPNPQFLDGAGSGEGVSVSLVDSPD